MALTSTSDQITNRYTDPPATPHSAGEVYQAPFDVTLTTAAINTLHGLAVIPADCIPIDIVMIVPDLDEGSSLEWDVGILNDDSDDLVSSSLLIDGATTVGQAAGTQRMNDYECAYEPATWLAESDSPEKYEEKIVAMKIIAAAATHTAGTIRGHVLYRAAHNGI